MPSPSLHQPAAPGSATRAFPMLISVILLGVALALIAAPAPAPARTGVSSPSACFPPQGMGGAGYLGGPIPCMVAPCLLPAAPPTAGLWNTFSGCWSLPGPGATQDYAFKAKFAISVPCVDSYIEFYGRAERSQPDMDALVRLQYDHASGNVTYYNAELLSMEFTPTGYPQSLLRESPTRASTGQYVVEEVSTGNYLISSFFDIYFDCRALSGTDWGAAPAPWHISLMEPVTRARTSTWGELKRIYR